MRDRLRELERRRLVLLERVAEQRAALVLQVQALQHPVGFAGHVWPALAALRARPWALAAAAAAVLAARPRRIAKWAGRLWIVWRGWQAVRAWLVRAA